MDGCLSLQKKGDLFDVPRVQDKLVLTKNKIDGSGQTVTIGPPGLAPLGQLPATAED